MRCGAVRCGAVRYGFQQGKIPTVRSVEDRFRLPPIEAMFSSIDWFIAVLLVVVAELESSVYER